MSAVSRLRGSAAVAITVGGLLAGCTGDPGGAGTSTPPPLPGSGPASGAPPMASRAPVSRPPLPSSAAPSSLAASPPVLAPVRSSPNDLGRVDVRNGSARRGSASVRLPAGSGYTVTAGCIGPPGTLLRYSVVGTAEPNAGFLFGSMTPCNGRFVTDAALANIDVATPARLEVELDAGVQDATVVLRPAPTDDHL